jgi:hypothetical protein
VLLPDGVDFFIGHQFATACLLKTPAYRGPGFIIKRLKFKAAVAHRKNCDCNCICSSSGNALALAMACSNNLVMTKS